MNEKYEQLKKVIQEVNPEIMELKFGCEIKWYDGQITTVLKYNPKEASGGILDVMPLKGGENMVYANECMILGRPIHLADILLIYGNIPATGKSYGGMTELERGVMQIYTRWNLHDDNLDHQSDETKQFLIDLLVK